MHLNWRWHHFVHERRRRDIKHLSACARALAPYPPRQSLCLAERATGRVLTPAKTALATLAALSCATQAGATNMRNARNKGVHKPLAPDKSSGHPAYPNAHERTPSRWCICSPSTEGKTYEHMKRVDTYHSEHKGPFREARRASALSKVKTQPRAMAAHTALGANALPITRLPAPPDLCPQC